MFAGSGPAWSILPNSGTCGSCTRCGRLPTFLAASRIATTGLPAESGPGRPGIGAFLTIGVAGLAGCLIGGWPPTAAAAPPPATAALAVSGACCLLPPLSFDTGRALLAFAMVWGAAAIGDSGMFSTLPSETADRR
jgi:hypothetical protein